MPASDLDQTTPPPPLQYEPHSLTYFLRGRDSVFPPGQPAAREMVQAINGPGYVEAAGFDRREARAATRLLRLPIQRVVAPEVSAVREQYAEVARTSAAQAREALIILGLASPLYPDRRRRLASTVRGYSRAAETATAQSQSSEAEDALTRIAAIGEFGSDNQHLPTLTELLGERPMVDVQQESQGKAEGYQLQMDLDRQLLWDFGAICHVATLLDRDYHEGVGSYDSDDIHGPRARSIAYTLRFADINDPGVAAQRGAELRSWLTTTERATEEIIENRVETRREWETADGDVLQQYPVGIFDRATLELHGDLYEAEVSRERERDVADRAAARSATRSGVPEVEQELD